MLKQVDELDFWRRRLNRAHAEGRPVHAAIYDCSVEAWEAIQGQTRQVLRRYVPQDGYVLDAGCGFGALYEVMPPGARYKGVDFSPDFIDIARQKFPRADFEVGNLKDLAVYRDHGFDLAVCRSLKGMWVENLGGMAWQHVREELLRVAKKLLLIEYEDVIGSAQLVKKGDRD